MQIQIRLARPDDWQTIVDFNSRLATESEGKELDRQHVEPGVQAVLADARKGRYLVAEVEDRIVGQLMHTYEWSDWRNGDIWWLQSVYVVPEHRRQGVFRALFDCLQHEAEADPAVVGLRLYVEDNNTHAHETYRNLGLAPGGYFVMQAACTAAVLKVNMPSKSSSNKRRILSSGKLRIGDEWNAINIIARTQTHPLQAVCELAENARSMPGPGKSSSSAAVPITMCFWKSSTTGKASNATPRACPTSARIATHVCDSMKRQLAEQERKGVHGEFGIGLLGVSGALAKTCGSFPREPTVGCTKCSLAAPRALTRFALCAGSSRRAGRASSWDRCSRRRGVS